MADPLPLQRSELSGRQYRYHDLWHEQRDGEKHDRVLEFGAALPRVRKVVLRHLEGTKLSRDRVLASAIRLVDLGPRRSRGRPTSIRG